MRGEKKDRAKEIESRRFQKDLGIEVRRQNLDVITHSATRLLDPWFDKNGYEKKKRRNITQDSKRVQRCVVEAAIGSYNMVPSPDIPEVEDGQDY